MIECKDQVIGGLNVIALEFFVIVITFTENLFENIGTVPRLGISHNEVDFFIIVTVLEHIELMDQTELYYHNN